MPGYGCWQQGLQGGLCEESELTAGHQVLRGGWEGGVGGVF